MSENLQVITGNEFQLEGFQAVIRSKEEANETIEQIIQKLQYVFKGETAHKIIRVNYQRGVKTFLFDAGFEKEMYNEIVDWLHEVMKREYYPLVFEFRNFLSFSSPRLIKG